jgi:hypothetical protein
MLCQMVAQHRQEALQRRQVADRQHNRTGGMDQCIAQESE